MNDRVQTDDAEQLINNTDSVNELIFHVTAFNPDDDATIPIDMWGTHDNEQDAIDDAEDVYSNTTGLDIAVQPRINRELYDATFTLDAA